MDPDPIFDVDKDLEHTKPYKGDLGQKHGKEHEDKTILMKNKTK